MTKTQKTSTISVMTEITNKTNRTDAMSQFILYWGDMGGQWGVNRSVAQIQALLFLSVSPLNAEQISEELGIARSNVSNSLKELVSWKLIRRVPVPGDRREHFEAETDVWEIARCVAQGRKAREIDPAMRVISDCVTTAESEDNLDPIVLKRMKDMQEFLRTADSWYAQMLGVPKAKLNLLLKMGNKVLSVLTLTGKKLD
ncbi:GbsR/MarR family transcriptional regulator [uncultured Roseobacter sp.]|uniref:GbsR/MarR family transcriptional regulator n=1 Tax=uncultured Roseobacter sp. TaxID=114847 RepID=UPI0026137E7D|nr:MarR family transcriptional regulator [uncultured Roseobacter sp.]